MKTNLVKPISLTLLVLLSLTSVVPAAQASELDNALVEPAPSQYYLSGLWLVLIYPEYTDIHLWYQLSDTTAHYVHTDHLTGSNVITDENGELEELLDYFPYGSIRIDEGTFDEKKKFAGHELDSDTGLSYMNARYYNSAFGRFLSQDPVFLEVGGSNFSNEIKGSIVEKFYVSQIYGQNQKNNQGLQNYLSNPQYLNAYSYTINNPVRYNDKNGKATFELGFGFTAGPAGLNFGVRVDPKVGWQIFSSNSIGLSFGFSVRYDPEGELDTRPRGEVYVERDLAIVPGIGGFKSTSADENSSRPFSLESNPQESSGFGLGLELGYSHSFVRNGDINTFSDNQNRQQQGVNTSNEQSSSRSRQQQPVQYPRNFIGPVLPN